MRLSNTALGAAAAAAAVLFLAGLGAGTKTPDLAKAREDSKLQVIQNQEDLAAARQKVERSGLELKDVQEGKGRLHEEEATACFAEGNLPPCDHLINRMGRPPESGYLWDTYLCHA